MNEINDQVEQKNYECLVTRGTSCEMSVSIEQNKSTSNSSSCEFCIK